MIDFIPWTQREFDFILPLGVPSILEPLRSTPARAVEIVESGLR